MGIWGDNWYKPWEIPKDTYTSAKSGGKYLWNKSPLKTVLDMAKQQSSGGAFEKPLLKQSASAGNFANQTEKSFTRLGQEANDERGYLRNVARGQDSISAEQLRQGLQQNIAAQQSIAASARPVNAVMAARDAAIQSARLGSGLAGQQALAGIAERQAAQQQLAAMLLQQRNQDLQGASAARGQAIQGYGQGFSGSIGQPSGMDRLLGLAQAGAMAYGAASDKRLKKNIQDGDGDADKFLKGLKAYRFRYKDGKFGEGDQLGIMAQDLEATNLGKQAVIDTPQGKIVHGAKLATALAATLPGLNKRLAKLESKKAA